LLKPVVETPHRGSQGDAFMPAGEAPGCGQFARGANESKFARDTADLSGCREWYVRQKSVKNDANLVDGTGYILYHLFQKGPACRTVGLMDPSTHFIGKHLAVRKAV